MLGGSVLIALIRYAVSIAGVIVLFLLMNESRFDRKKTAACYILFSVGIIVLSCIWYIVHWQSCVRLVAFVIYLGFAVVSLYLSKGPLCLSVYKLALTFYLMSVFVVSGIEISILFFSRSVWADIAARIVIIVLLAVLIDRKIKESIRGFGRYMASELDQFSVAIMIISILCGIGFILNPRMHDQTPYRIYQIILNFFLTGALQLLVFRLYLHIGKEKEYQKEYQLMQMNQRLLERNVELLEESMEAGRRIRHDARHHNAVIAEYVHRGQHEELLQYLREYEKEMDAGIVKSICGNTAVNNILSAYTKKAEKAGIRVTLDVELGRNVAIPSIDLVAILANAYENAIYGCMEVRKEADGRECFIHLMLKKKRSRLVICCKNTCRIETAFRNGQPKPEFTGGVGVLSITKTADKYGGEYDFKNDDGIFVFRLVMNIPETDGELHAPGGRG